MAKTKTGLLSLGAHGSVANALTYQKRGKQTVARGKPHPSDPKTLPQIYQRWLYQDYVAWWQTLSADTKKLWETLARPHRMSGFAYWMSVKLTDLPDIMGMWHLDEKSGSIAHDSSRYQTHGTILGATPTIGVIDGAQYFTINDWIRIPAPQCNFTTEDFSFSVKFRCDDLTAHRCILSRGFPNTDGYKWFVMVGGAVSFRTYQAAAIQNTTAPAGTIVPGVNYTLGLRRIGNSVRIFKDGVDVTSGFGNHLDPAPSTRFLEIGSYGNGGGYRWEGMIDHLIAYDRALLNTDFIRHSERRYPL